MVLKILQWQKCLGGTGEELANSIQQTAAGYIVSGGTESNDGDVIGSHGAKEIWVVELDNNGNIQSQKCLGGTGVEEAGTVQPTTNNSSIALGSTESNDGDVSGNNGSADAWLVKLDVSGTIQWQKCLGGTLGELYTSGQQTSDLGYIAAGYTTSNDGDVSGNHGSSDMWVTKLGPDEVDIAEVNPLRYSVAPNPVASLLTITCDQQARLTQLTLLDATGRTLVVHSVADASTGPTTLDISSYARGPYILHMVFENGFRAQERVMKE
ncbi:MAG: T9SS type A sorting domain-containing protein [Flavobacteriales bacterium]|nr:T9SS type A sorting domain-containing protein [Flavobacteriales bacterium]